MASIVVAPDSFKGSADASVAARAISAGWSRIRPEDDIILAPMADGGEGTVDAFAAAYPEAILHPLEVEGPDGRPVDAAWLHLPDGAAVVELACASGITLLDPLQPFDADTTGFGQLIADAIGHGANRLLLAIGGSSSTDGGTGALRALGARFLDATGSPVGRGNRGLASLESIDRSGLRDLPVGGAIVLSDVTNPLLGASGAAAVFGPQKGAINDEVAVLEANLARLALLAGGAPEASGAGAAGGTGYGLMLWGAALAPGAAAVGGALGMPRAVASADLVITGEGRFDSQSAAGKVPSYLQDLAAAAGVPVALVAGLIEAPTDAFADAVALTELAGDSASAQADAERWLERAGEVLASRYDA
jgi:glycerate kinase